MRSTLQFDWRGDRRTFTLRRGDYFWGFGPKAGQWASRMNETGRMWLLLPRDLKIAMGPAMQTRGIAPRGEAEPLLSTPRGLSR